jgi:predicted permease
VIRQLLTESVLLGVLGGAAGLVVAWASLYMVRTINPGNIPRMETIGINGGVLAFTFGVSILTGIVFGLAPALRVSRVDLNTSLKAGGRASQGDGGFTPGKHRLRSLLVVTELSLSLMLLIGAGLLIRSFARLSSVSPGFNPDRLITMRLAVAGPRYRPVPPARPVWQFYEQVAERVRRLPGVKSHGAVSVMPLTQTVSWGGMSIEGWTPGPGEELQVDQRIASVDYFRTMEVPLVKGRFFNDQDTPDVPPVVIVDQKFADRFWPGGDAIGKRIGGGPNRPWSTIVGVVGRVKQYGLEIDGRMVVYRAHCQATSGGMYLVARTSTDPGTLAASMVREIHAVDSDVPVYDVRTMQDRVDSSLARQRSSMAMLAAFAGFALILAAVGIYGVMSYLVMQGTHDIGVRIALGAQRGSILGMVVKQGMSLAGMGIVAGLIGAAALTRVMASLLFGVSTTDAVTFSSVAVFLAAVALAASYVPALRATRVDPIVALRDE